VEHFPLTQVVQSALDLTAHVLREHEVALSVEHAQADLPVRGDSHQLSQVVMNLVINASTAMEDSSGPRRLAIRTRLDEPAGMVELSVSDTGPGIPPQLRERIFERFFTTKAVGEGTGLGLAICRDIVSAHGGRISVHDAPQGGARFVVQLPVGRHIERAGHSTTDDAAAMPRYRMLVVDDELEIAELLREILEQAGHEVDVAASGEAALRRIDELDYDFILSDIRMPGMDGTALYDVLCSKHPELVPRLAFVTGDTLSPNVASFLKRTGIPHLAKPFHPREVNAMVARLAQARRRGARRSR
jgi:CheY-like chemotaxis protein